MKAAPDLSALASSLAADGLRADYDEAISRLTDDELEQLWGIFVQKQKRTHPAER